MPSRARTASRWRTRPASRRARSCCWTKPPARIGGRTRRAAGKIWASSDWRVVWQKHNPAVLYVDDFAADAFPTTPGTAGSWFSRLDRPTSEVKQIAAVSGTTITFTTPIHISYRQSHAAQLSRYGRRHVKNAGVEDLTLTGGDAGNLRFNWAALSWAKNVESTVWHGEGVAIHSSFRVELREFYIHDGAWSQPGGGGYAISLSAGTAEVLIENGIAVRANKVMVARSAGAGSVVGYNYMDMSYINTNGAWVETGINASHMVGSHHVLFEGNYGHNADSDNTHGNSIYHTFFRNQFARRPRAVRQPGRRTNRRRHATSQRAAALRRPDGLFLLDVVRRQRARGRGTDGWLGLRSHVRRRQADDLDARLGRREALSNRRPGRGHDASPRQLRLPHQHGEVGSGNRPPCAAELAVSGQEARLLRRPAAATPGRGSIRTEPTKLHTLPAKARYDAGTPFTQP